MTQGRTIQSVARALGILELFNSKASELSVTDIAAQSGLSKSTAFGLINTLAESGYLEQNKENSRYTLGLKLLKLGSLIQKNNIVCRKSRPYLEILVHEFNETAHLAIRHNDKVVYIDKIKGNKALYIKSSIGNDNPMYCTGVGKCLLAFLAESERDRILADYTDMPKRTPNTIINANLLRKELERIRQLGYSLDDEEFEMGLLCIAVPIFDNEQKVIAAISVAGPKASFERERVAAIAEYMQKVSLQISATL